MAAADFGRSIPVVTSRTNAQVLVQGLRDPLLCCLPPAYIGVREADILSVQDTPREQLCDRLFTGSSGCNLFVES